MESTRQVYVSFVSLAGVQEATCSLAEAAESGLLDDGAWDLVGRVTTKPSGEIASLPVPARRRPVATASVCPNCGASRADLEKHGRLGCATCYAVFTGFLERVLPKLHRGTRHHGKQARGFRPGLPGSVERGPDRRLGLPQPEQEQAD